MGLQVRFLFGLRRWFFASPFVAFVLIICVIATTKLLSSSIGQYGKNALGTVNALTGSDVIVYPPPIVKGVLKSRADTWEDCVKLGRLLKCLFEATNEADAQRINEGRPVASKFLDYGDIWSWGYNIMELDETYPLYGYSLNQAFHDLKIDIKKNIEYGYIHSCREADLKTPRLVKNKDGLIIPPSSGTYINVINPEAGAIIADDNESPRYAKPGLPVYPNLQLWSDVVFLQWQQFAKDIKNINWCFRAQIVNKATQDQVIKSYEGSGHSEIGNYLKRVTFEMKNDYGLAILGTRNGAGCGYLLAQHKEKLGLKKITEVTVWAAKKWVIGTNQDDLKLSMYFKVVPV